MTYIPKPIDTSEVELSPEVVNLLERLAENAHDIWGKQRIDDGWTFGPKRNDDLKHHPGLIPYAELSEGEKEYDRIMVGGVLKAILALGYKIEPTEK